MRVLVFITLCLAQTACATVVRGTHEDFKVSTQPAGASVSTTLETKSSKKARKKDPSLSPKYHKCPATPCEFEVPRRTKFVAIIEKDGFAAIPVIVNGKSALSGQTASIGLPTAGATASSAALGLTSSGLTATTASGLAFSTGLFTTMFAVPVIAVDAASGSMLSLTPTPLEVDLPPITENEAPPVGAYDLDKLSDGNDTFK